LLFFPNEIKGRKPPLQTRFEFLAGFSDLILARVVISAGSVRGAEDSTNWQSLLSSTTHF